MDRFRDLAGQMRFYDMDNSIHDCFHEIAQRLNKISDIPIEEDATRQMVPLNVAIAIINDVARKYNERRNANE